MNIETFPYDELIKQMSPDDFYRFHELCNAEHLADVSPAELLFMLYVYGWLGNVLNGYMPFKRDDLIRFLNFGTK